MVDRILMVIFAVWVAMVYLYFLLWIVLVMFVACVCAHQMHGVAAHDRRTQWLLQETSAPIYDRDYISSIYPLYISPTSL